MGTETNASALRIHKNKGFTVMSNHHLRNSDLSLKAVGLMLKILSLPEDWNYSIAGLVKICKEGETAVRAALHELIDNKYIYVEKISPSCSRSGRFEYIYHIYEIPYENVPDGLEHPELFTSVEKKNQLKISLNPESRNKEKQDVENLYVETQSLENQGQLNTKESNTKELNTKEIKKEKQKAEKKQFAEAVYMTESEYQNLCDKHSKAFADKCIEVLNNYKLSKGKFYKSDYHAVLAWVEKKVSDDLSRDTQNQTISVPIQTDPYENPFAKYLSESGDM